MKTYKDLPRWDDGYNLDAMSDQELALISKFFHSPTVTITQHLWPNGGAPASPYKGMRTIALIASLMHAARKDRLDGKIQSALKYEHEAERHYDSLPDWTKW